MKLAVLPVGSFEQHGAHLPPNTDTLIAEAIARGVATECEALLLPALGVSCSHEHQDFGLAVSLKPETLCALVREMAAEVFRQDLSLALINAHGGNYVLYNLAQSINCERPRSLVILPLPEQWRDSMASAGIVGSRHDDMHAGEAETSLLLHLVPDKVRLDRARDELSSGDRSLLHFDGMAGITKSGVVGRPSLATAQKGKALLAALVRACAQSVRECFDRE